MKALVVDDANIVALILKRMLETAGYSVVSAADGDEAVARFRAESFDVVIMDHHMPNVVGSEAVAEIRRIEKELKREPSIIFASTSHPSPAIEAELTRAGANALLPKPTSQNALLEALNHAKAG